MTTINVEIEEKKGGMAISLEMGRSEDSSQSELMFATYVRSKMEEALNSITSDDDEGSFLRFLMSIMSKHSNDEDIEKALCKEGKE